MLFRLCLCVALLFVCGYANNSSDYCRALFNYDKFKTSLDQFLASWNETGGGTDMGSENKTTCLAAMVRRVIDLENKVEKLLNDNENKEARLSYMEITLANLTSDRSVDCSPPTPQEGTDVYISTGLRAMANYRCKTGFVSVHPGPQTTSLCQKDGNWTMVNVKCVDLSGCWMDISGRVVYTGTQSNTTTGKVCQRWDSQMPHGHRFTEDRMYWIPGFDTPQTVNGSANYCRDLDRTGSVWCYTTDESSRWETCDVPKCNI